MIDRRRFLAAGTAGVVGASITRLSGPAEAAAWTSLPQEDLINYILRTHGKWDVAAYCKLLGAANEFKEGDEIVGVSAASEGARTQARQLLSATKVSEIDQRPAFVDGLYQFIENAVREEAKTRAHQLTFGELKAFLLERDEAEIHAIKEGLSSDVIACVVRLMTNEELIRVGAKVFNPLPGSKLGAKGYMGARIQPNSPTDHVDDIQWQVFDAFSYAVGDLLVGTNPVSSTPESVHAVQKALQEILTTFGIDEVLPHCVLSHIDVQAEVEQKHPGSTELWFQSIAGNDAANKTFDISVEKMKAHANSRKGRFGLYFETGQGADFTNGHGHSVDMVLHESRKYGFVRALSKLVSSQSQRSGLQSRSEPPTADSVDSRASSGTRKPWVHVNDVAGFIGPEVFRTREQLVRCCLEDIVMGKLHGLMIGLDVCSTLHMDVSLDDLGWCIDQVMPANPGYLMALPTRIDPMLGYLTTSFQDHVRVREKFGYKVDDRMWTFFQKLGVIDAAGKPTEHFGDPAWVYLQFRREKGDVRAEKEIRAEAKTRIAEVRARGVFIAEGFGRSPSEMAPELSKQVKHIYDDAKISIWRELDARFVATVPEASRLRTQSKDRMDYISHPTTGEQLSDASKSAIDGLRAVSEGFDTQLVISDGLNALAVMDGDQLSGLLQFLRRDLARMGRKVSPTHLVVDAGRVRAGYRIGEQLFGGRKGKFALLHVIGERPGSGHHTLSIYMTIADGATWAVANKVDHNITKVVSGIANTSLKPALAAAEAVKILGTM